MRSRLDGNGYVISINGKTVQITDSDQDKLLKTNVFRIDPINSCNAQCIFCDSNFDDRTKQLDFKVFKSALDFASKSPVLHTIQFGCTYEPTLHKDFSKFGEYLANSSLASHPPHIISIVSNCWLLDKHNLEPFVKSGLNKLHASVHAFDNKTLVDVMGPTAKIELIERNLKEFKIKYPHIPISVVYVLNRKNYLNIEQLVEWFLFNINADYLRLTRAKIDANQDKQPSRQALLKLDVSDGFELTDEQWELVLSSLKNINKQKVIVEITKQRLKGGTISVDAIRFRKLGILKENLAPDLSRQKYKDRHGFLKNFFNWK